MLTEDIREEVEEIVEGVILDPYLEFGLEANLRGIMVTPEQELAVETYILIGECC